MAKKHEETALAETEKNQALTTFAADFGADADQYQDSFAKDDFAIPFLQVIQSNSKQVQAGEAKYMEDAKAGMLIETVSNTLYDVKKQPLIIIPAHYEKRFILWRTRENGGGFVSDHNVTEGLEIKATCTPDEKGRLITHEDYQLVETASYAVVIYGGDTPVSALFPLTSTQLKKSRQWNTAIDSLRIDWKGKRVKPPMFYMSYTISTTPEKNDKGSWMGLVIKPYKPVTELKDGEEYYNAAKVLREGVDAGRVNTAKSAAASGEAGDNPDSEPANNGSAPF